MLFRHWTSRFAGIFEQLIVCWDELSDFNFLSIEFLSISLHQILAGFSFAIE